MSPGLSSASLASPAGQRGRARSRAAIITLILVTLLTFANAAPDAVVFDDTAFVGPGAHHQTTGIVEAFQRDLWNHPGFRGGLYRPLLLVNFELERRVFGDWLPGYHLVNIALHLAATLMLFGFVRLLLMRDPRSGDDATLYALLAALIFTTHPAHTEVVNSVFNRSSIIVTLCAIGGLWWLFRYLESRPAKAWTGFGLIYSFAILFKESALVLPGIAVALVVFLTDGTWRERVRRFLPVFWLLIPIALYFLARAYALAPAGAAESAEAMPEIGSILEATRLTAPDSPLAAVALFGEGLKVLAWPYPSKLIYESPSDLVRNLYLTAQVVLLVWALWLWRRGRPVLIASLAFYYIALTPATRLLSMDGSYPHLAERYLYYPSAGLTIALAFGIGCLVRRFGSRPVTGLTLPLLILLAAISWDRNADWGSQILLFEKEYQRGEPSGTVLRILSSSLLNAGQYPRAVEICDENPERFDRSHMFVESCVVAYSRVDRIEDAIAVLKIAMQEPPTWVSARLTLASIYLARRQYQEAADLYVEIINRADEASVKEFYRGELLFKLYPERAEALEQAKVHYEESLRLDPDPKTPRKRLEEIESRLQELADPAASPQTPETDPE